jgi:hypothetical protein
MDVAAINLQALQATLALVKEQQQADDKQQTSLLYEHRQMQAQLRRQHRSAACTLGAQLHSSR